MFNLDCGIPNRGDTNTTMMDGDRMRTGIGEYPWQVSFALNLRKCSGFI